MTTIGIKPKYDTTVFQAQKPSTPQNDAKRSNHGNTDLDLPSYGNRVQNARDKLPNFNVFDNSYENSFPDLPIYGGEFGRSDQNGGKNVYPGNSVEDFIEDFSGSCNLVINLQQLLKRAIFIKNINVLVFLSFFY